MRCQGHKLIVVSGVVFALVGWLFFAIAPVGLEPIDSGVPDQCGAAAECTPERGVLVEGNPANSPNETMCGSTFEADRDEREADYEQYGEYAIHSTMQACPTGCCFVPRWSHVEYTRWFDAVVKMFLLTLPALQVGLNEKKMESFCFLMIGILALAYYSFYLVGTFELQKVCAEYGHDNLSPEEAIHYGNDHACQQITSDVVMLVWNIITAIAAVAGGLLAGLLYQEDDADDNFANGTKDKDFDGDTS